jgi:uncharacterized protein
MTLLVPQSGDIPRPVPGPISEPYWAGCRAGVLRYQRCRDCGSATHTPAVLCAGCASRDLEWVDSAGRGEIYSWTRVWRPATPAFVTPYVPLIVTMEEGWQVLANLVGCDDADVAVGLPVEVEFHALEDGFALPYFHLADRTGS